MVYILHHFLCTKKFWQTNGKLLKLSFCNWMKVIALIIFSEKIGFGQYTRYKIQKLYLKSAFNFNISNISHSGYFTDKQSERLYKYKHITNHRKLGLISQKFTLL